MSRTHTWEGVTITYPNATHFAYDPAMIRIANIPGGAPGLGITVTDTQTNKAYDEYREAIGGKVSIDICRYLQLMFNGMRLGTVDYGARFVDSPLKRTAVLSIYWLVGAKRQIVMTAKIDALWGNIHIGESTGGVISRRWFVNYPFTLDVFTASGAKVDVTTGGVLLPFIDLAPDAIGATCYRRRLLNPQHCNIPSDAQSARITIPEGIVLKNDAESVGETVYDIVIDRGCRGAYLRWIDHQGRYCYYLFRQTGEGFATSVASSWERHSDDLLSTYTDGQNIGTPRQQALTTKHTTSLGAKLVDAVTFDFLLTATQSPVVDLFDGYDSSGAPLWHRVNVVAGNYTKTTKHYQDFALTIEQPEQNTQTI